jgi:hypothetical protein
LKVGGLAFFEARIFNTPYSIGSGFVAGNAAGVLTPGIGPVPFFTPGVTPPGASYRNARARDNYGLGALGRVELDARTATGYGTLRAFIRVDSSFGTSSTSQTGALNQLYNTTAGPFPAKEQSIVSRSMRLDHTWRHVLPAGERMSRVLSVTSPVTRWLIRAASGRLR